MTPTEWFAKQVKEYRTDRRWTQPELARRCKAAGLDWDRSIVANVEAGRRHSVTVQEVFTLAHVLAVPPVMLLLPLRSGESVEVAEGVGWHPGLALRWFVGQDGAYGVDDDGRKFNREAQPAVLYLELGRTHRRTIDANLNVRAMEQVHGKRSGEATAARASYREAVSAFFKILRDMDNIGMALPSVEDALVNDANRFGVELPKAPTRPREES